MKLILMILAVFCSAAFAQTVAPPTFLDGILNWIQGLNPSVVAGVMAVLEVVLRAVPTPKAMSILIPIKYVCDGLVVILGWLSSLLGALINSVNNVAPMSK